jgi:hypothetical protein
VRLPLQRKVIACLNISRLVKAVRRRKGIARGLHTGFYAGETL